MKKLLTVYELAREFYPHKKIIKAKRTIFYFINKLGVGKKIGDQIVLNPEEQEKIREAVIKNSLPVGEKK